MYISVDIQKQTFVPLKKTIKQIKDWLQKQQACVDLNRTKGCKMLRSSPETIQIYVFLNKSTEEEVYGYVFVPYYYLEIKTLFQM